MAYASDGKQGAFVSYVSCLTNTLRAMDRSPREILAENLWTLIRAHPGNADRPSVRAWALTHGLDEKKVHRALTANDVQLVATLEELALKLNRPVWELLHPAMSAHRRLAPPELSADALDVAKALDRISDPQRRAKAYALMIQIAEFENAPPGAPSTPAPSPRPSARPARHR